MTPKELIREAMKFVEKGWTQKTAARCAFGLSVLPKDELAREWCLIGAIQAAEPGDDIELRAKTYALFWKPLGTDAILDWNDTPGRTQAEVLELMRRASDEE